MSECGRSDEHDAHALSDQKICFGHGSDDEVTENGTKQVLRDWWIDLAAAEADKVIPKAVEYGSNSMIDVGHQMARAAGRMVGDEEAQELACYFYLVGKMGRWADALARHKRVSDDTLHDIGVYVRMAQRIRSVGGWPFGPADDKDQGEIDG